MDEGKRPIEEFQGVIVSKPWGYEYLMYQNGIVTLWYLHIEHGCGTSMHCHPRKKTGLILRCRLQSKSSYPARNCRPFHWNKENCKTNWLTFQRTKHLVALEIGERQECRQPGARSCDLCRSNWRV